MAFMKSLLKFFLKVVLVIVILLVVICAGLFVYYLVTIQSAEDYLPERFLFYVKIDSLKDIYNNVLDLRAADLIFSQPEFRDVYGALLKFKSNEFVRNDFLKMLLDMRSSIVVHEDRSMSLILEPGLLSIATRNFGLINSLIKIENLNLSSIQKGKITIYSINLNPSEQFFFSMTNNLVFLSNKRENIENLFHNFESGKNLKTNKSLTAVREKLGERGLLDLYVSTPTLIDMFLKDSPDLYQALAKLSFGDLSLISFSISNNELRIGVYSSYTPQNESLKTFLAYIPPSLQSISYFPLNTSVFSSINVKSFRDLYNILVIFQGEGFSRSFADIDGSAKSYLGISADDLLFNWAGEEVGAFLVGDSVDPVVFCRIKDRARLDATLKTLDDSLLLDNNPSLVFNNVRLSHIDFPVFIRALVDMFVKNLYLPYFHRTDDFIFFCMNPEILSHAVNDFKAGRVLVRSENFKATTEKLAKNANIFLYYDLTKSTPPFFPAKSLPARLLSLYESGAISLYYNENEIRAFMNAEGIAGGKTKAFRNYPKKLDKGTLTDVFSVNLKGTAVNEIVYIDTENNLVIQEIDGESLKAPVPPQSSIIISDGVRPQVFVYSASGTLCKYDSNAKSISPFPVVTMFKNSFPPVDTGSDLLFYSKSDNAFFLLPKSGGKEKRIDFTIEKEVFAAPTVGDGLIAFYPKSFDGTVFVIDFLGNLKKGWSQKGGGISYCSPLFLKTPGGEMMIVFLTQAGDLNAWDKDGRPLSGFPRHIDGTYYCNPAFVSYSPRETRAIVILNEQGVATLIRADGTILKQKPVPDAGNKKSMLTVFDIDQDGIEEIFIYGAGNFVIGLDKNLEMLPGFPVKGGHKPLFMDINLDRKKEMLTAGFDNQLYAYDLNK